MCGAGLSPDRLDLTYFVQADEQKNLEQDPALQVTRVRDGAKTRKAAASRLRRNSKAPFELISPTEFVERAELKSSASSEIQLLLLAMFQVSVSWVEIPFIDGGLAYQMPTEFGLTDLRGEKNCGARFAPGANAAKLREFSANSRRTTRAIMTVSFEGSVSVADPEGDFSASVA